MRVTNQTPQTLRAHYDAKLTGDFDPKAILDAVVTNPILTPTVASAPVTVTTGGATLTDDEVSEMIGNCLSDTFDATAEVRAKLLLEKTLVHYDHSWDMPVTELFVEQAALTHNLPEPKYPIAYFASQDVIPSSKGFLAGQCDFDFWFASLACFARPDTFGVAFVNEVAFDKFKEWANAQVATLSSVLSPVVNQTFANFMKSMSLTELTDSTWLRKSAADGNEEYSFPRLMVSLIMTYTDSVAPKEAFICPFSLDRLIVPESIVFINIERHSQSQPAEIEKEWEMIKNSISASIRVLRPGQVQSLTAAARQQARAASAAAMAQQQNAMPAAKALNVRFRKTAPTQTDIVRIVRKVLSKMAFVNHSQNVYKSTKMSFARPNRRDPDDFNKQGRITSTRYLPDIHLYVDTSGSISERQYQDAVKACILLARKLDINLYFNSFSHVMTTTTFLPTKGRSERQIWNTIQKIPKVTGGTDYLQIWRYIMASKKRRRELSLVITDFEWYPPTRQETHPTNIYYLPISGTNWDYLCAEAQTFANNMTHIDPNIRKKILF